MNHRDLNTKLSSHLEGKVVVTDTSALLVSGTKLLREVENSFFVVPMVVMRELESKRTDPSVGYLAREWIRLFESLREKHGEELLHGIELENGNRVAIQPNHSSQTNLPKHLQDGSVDSTILAVALRLNTEEGESKDLNTSGESTCGRVVVLSNDTPMRLYATLDLGMESYEYSSVSVEGASIFSGTLDLFVKRAPEVDSAISDGSPDLSTLFDLFSDSRKGAVNGELIERDGLPAYSLVNLHVVSDEEPDYKVLAFLDTDSFSLCDERSFKSVSPSGVKPRTLKQKMLASYLTEDVYTLPVVSVAGRAGTGKTLLTIASGIQGVLNEDYDGVLVLKSLHEMGLGQEMGFLPGTFDDKMLPWTGAISDSLSVIGSCNVNKANELNPGNVKSLLGEMIEVSPITYLRGRSLTNTYIVVEEAQNFSESEVLNILSRVGEGSKVVLTWDPDQVDNRFLQSGPKCDMHAVVNSMKASPLFAHLTLDKTERSEVAALASSILEGNHRNSGK